MSDRSTVISIVPFAIKEYKPGLFPPSFSLKASIDNEPEILVIEPAYFFVPVPEHPQKTFRIETNSNKVAHSIVEDFLESQLARSVEDEAEPGIFWVDDAYTSKQVKEKFRNELNEAKDKQTRWFLSLVKMADDDFQQAHRHEVVSDTQRFAARYLGLEREWIMDLAKIRSIASKTCPVCTSKILEKAIVCSVCRAVLNEQEYAKFKFAA